MNVAVFGGAGYVGLITGLGLAEIGHQVINVDIDRGRIRELQSGQSPIHEEGLEPALKRNLAAGRIRFSNDIGEAVESSEALFIAVGTPSREDGQADLSQVIKVAEEMAQRLNTYKIIAIKSTVPVGTVELVQSILRREKQEGKDFDIVSNPEFLREGKGLYDFFYPDRIVVGACSKKARSIMYDLYRPIIQGEVSWPEEGTVPGRTGAIPMVETDLASAQMIKYASNAFLATRISFINEIAGLCEKVGADIDEVARGAGYDPRIGHRYLQAGPGFGGPCLEKDLRALIKIGEGNGKEPRLLRAVLERNETQLEEMVGKLKQLSGYLLYKKIVAVFGLSFKAGTGDTRNSLSMKVIERLENEGAIVQAHDPAAIGEARTLRPQTAYFVDPYEAVQHADALLVLTEWPCFRNLDYEIIKQRMAFPHILDTRNLLDPEALRALGFVYLGVGKP